MDAFSKMLAPRARAVCSPAAARQAPVPTCAAFARSTRRCRTKRGIKQYRCSIALALEPDTPAGRAGCVFPHRGPSPPQSAEAVAAASASAAATAAAAATASDSSWYLPTAQGPLSQQELLDMVAGFVSSWFAGITHGSVAVAPALTRIVDAAVVITPDAVRTHRPRDGVVELLAELERAHLEYHASQHRPLLYAASVEAQRAYALVEGRHQDVGALPGRPATFRVSKVHHIVALQIGENGRVARLWLRRQLTEEDKDELLAQPLRCTPAPFPCSSLCSTDTATPNGATARVRMAEVVRAWWAAWNIDHGAAAAESTSAAKTATRSDATPSGAMHAGDKCPPPRLSHQGARSRLPRSTDPIATAVSLLSADFRLCDAYGLWPAMRTLGQRYLHRDAALHHFAKMRYGHNLSVTVHDIAVAEGSLATFTHWTARVTPRWCDHDHGHHHDGGEHCSSGADQQQPQPPGLAAAGEEEVLEGIEVDVFDAALALQEVWLFRGPLESCGERSAFLSSSSSSIASGHEALKPEALNPNPGALTPATAGAAGATASDGGKGDAAISPTTYDGQLVAELVAGVADYAQQWGAQLTGLRRALQRKQELAVERLRQQVFVMEQMHKTYERLQADQRHRFAELLAAQAEEVHVENSKEAIKSQALRVEGQQQPQQ